VNASSPAASHSMIVREQRKQWWWRGVLAGLILGGLLVTSSPASAQATVSVRVTAPRGGPGEAEVTLTAPGGERYGCTTRSGRCRIASVPGGRYVVTAAPTRGGQRPGPREVVIPPSGEVSLIVSLR
jgi:hypothetical protein